MPEIETLDMAAAVDDEAIPPEYPPGAPVLMTIAQIRPRSKRAEFKRKLADFTGLQEAAEKMQAGASATKPDGKADQPTQIRTWADMDDLYQLMVELMELAAVNPEHCLEWTDAADDQELLAVFQVFMRKAQPGEAPSSTS